MRDVIEVSYTADLLAHRRCARAWAYEKQAGFQPYEAVQAMEGRLIHHAMEWLTAYHREHAQHAPASALREQLEHCWRILWARGIRSGFISKEETLDRVMGNLYTGPMPDLIVQAVIEGALHAEYELRAVRKVLPEAFGGKSRMLLTGVLDLVVQQRQPIPYAYVWDWDAPGGAAAVATHMAAEPGETEIWDYKGTRADTSHLEDYVRQILTYAALYRDRAGSLPARGVLFFVNELRREHRLLAINIDEAAIEAALDWTHAQVQALHETTVKFEQDPNTVDAGDLALRKAPVGQRLGPDTKKQCTACSFRFDCSEYVGSLRGGASHPDVDRLNVFKN